MRVMILAAGLGTRLRPLTEEISKPMVPIANKPVMEHTIELLAKHGFRKAIANLHYHPRAIISRFSDGKEWGLELSYSHEEELFGTAGGVRNVKSFFNDETFLIVSGDALTDIDLTDLLNFHHQKKAMATIVLTPVENPSKYGVVITDEDSRIISFQEKPLREEAQSNLANSGIYVLEPEVFDYIPAGVFYDFGKQVFPALLESRAAFIGYTHNDYWNDVGSLEEYQQGNFDALTGRVDVNIPGTKISNDIWIGKNCRIQEDVVMVGPICIGNNCVIKRNSKLFGPLCIGDNTIIDEGATLSEGIKWGDGYIGKDASLIGSIIGSATQIRDGAAVLKNAVIGKGCVIGGGSIIHPSVIVASDKIIEINQHVTDSII